MPDASSSVIVISDEIRTTLEGAAGRVWLAKSRSGCCPSEQNLVQPLRHLLSRRAVAARNWNWLPSSVSTQRCASGSLVRLLVVRKDASTKKGRSPREGSGPQDLRSADQRLSKRVCFWTTVLRETRIGSCDWVTMRTVADCITGTKNDPGVCAGRPPLSATGGLWRRRLKLLPMTIANGRRGCTDRHAPRCCRGHGSTCSWARCRPLVAHGPGDG